MPRTKIAGYILIAMCTLKIVYDILIYGFSTKLLISDFDAFALAVGGSGFVFIRSAIQKVEDLIASFTPVIGK